MTIEDPEALGQTQGVWLQQRVARHLRKHKQAALDAGGEVFRWYDRDIPELPLTIDRYRDHLHVAVWSRGVEADADARRHRLQRAMATLAAAHGIPVEHIHWKDRERKRGASQYEAAPDASCRLQVREGGLVFEVELERYLDTGLFLDHRLARAEIRARAAGLRVLNLFSYTGAFSVFAAAGGAASTDSVDLSATYGAWAERNLAANGAAPADHRVHVADARLFLENAESRGRRWDLVICDAPAFSNSKRTRITFDVQRDQGGLIRRLRAVLAPRGALLFATNHRGFELEPTHFDGMRWQEQSARTVPPEFRDRAIHRSFLAELP